ncbi:HNH endonuclease signature motif containing protein [Phaeobacter sp. JH20_36]|uniref:HNH endonuclease n=1 Tax=Phaeobacter TaxID=302485 RepID=UPI0021A5C246|nr:HNH endonuclease signature motif containing protein [Phaeobacter inhibens]UWR99680.1 HNH endonuclease [Phaeobacter inhibens]
MKNLPRPPKTTARDDLETVLYTYNYKGEVRGYAPTRGEIDAILAVYDLYDQSLGAPSDALKGPGLAPALNSAIRHAYPQTYENGKIPHIRETAFENVDLCPICGVDPPVELDHHLPKSVFEPLSLYAWNLVPLCEACNKAKLAKDAGNFVHAYFDIVPDEQFLQVDVSIEDGGLITKYSIDENAQLAAPLLAKLKFQMEALSLNTRFQKDVNTNLVAHTTGLHMAAEFGGGDGVKRYLGKQASIETDAFHRNHWRPVLLNALVNHDEFCNGGFKDVLPDGQAGAVAGNLATKEPAEEI